MSLHTTVGRLFVFPREFRVKDPASSYVVPLRDDGGRLHKVLCLRGPDSRRSSPLPEGLGPGRARSNRTPAALGNGDFNIVSVIIRTSDFLERTGLNPCQAYTLTCRGKVALSKGQMGADFTQVKLNLPCTTWVLWYRD